MNQYTHIHELLLISCHFSLSIFLVAKTYSILKNYILNCVIVRRTGIGLIARAILEKSGQLRSHIHMKIHAQRTKQKKKWKKKTQKRG